MCGNNFSHKIYSHICCVEIFFLNRIPTENLKGMCCLTFFNRFRIRESFLFN